MDRKTDTPCMLPMLGLSILSLGGLGIAATGRLSADQTTILQFADLVTCALFFLDFLVTLKRAPNKLRYFSTWGWLDLLSSIPMVDALRLTRIARVFRILRLIRGVKATKLLAEFILKRRAQGAFLAVSLLSLLAVVASSIAILHFEAESGSNIRTAQDAVWWPVATLTTVGYGDVYPITLEGRIIASVLMVCGVALLGTLSGLAASWFLGPSEARHDRDDAELLSEVRKLVSTQETLLAELVKENAELRKGVSTRLPALHQ